MSLKGFHIVFVTLATLCLVGFAVWTVVRDVETVVRLGGILSGVSGVGLAIYGSWFYCTKLRDSNF